MRKPIRKKVASAPKKNTSRKGKASVGIVRPRADLARQNKVLRNQAGTDFVVDDQGRSIRYHYERKDRLYSVTVGWDTFQRWAIDDKWIDRRAEFWEQMEDRVIANYADKIFRARLTEMGKLETLIEKYEQYLLPLVDPKTGKLQIDDNGLPKFGLKLPTLDKFAEMYLKIHERLLLLRGDVTNRSEQIGKGQIPVTAHTDDPASVAPKLNRSEARAMARALLHERQKELASPEVTGVVEEPVSDDSAN